MQSFRLGIPGTLLFWFHRFVRHPHVISIRPHQAAFPVYVRPCDSDLDVLSQVFIHQHYAGITLDDEAGLIIDCGANVGLSTSFFLTRFPRATVIAVEPDAANCELLRRNVAPYGLRARVVEAAVWPANTKLRMRAAKYDDGRSWARQVEEAAIDGETTIQGTSIDSLLAESGFNYISLLKMDIEGAEVPILQSTSKAWLAKTRCLAIELHDDTHFGNATAAFEEAVRKFSPEIRLCGEITVAYFSQTRLS